MTTTQRRCWKNNLQKTTWPPSRPGEALSTPCPSTLHGTVELLKSCQLFLSSKGFQRIVSEGWNNNTQHSTRIQNILLYTTILQVGEFQQTQKRTTCFFSWDSLSKVLNSTSLTFRWDRVRANSDVHGIEPFPTSLMMSRARCKMPKPSASFASKQSIQLDPCLLSNHLEHRNRKMIQINTWYSTGCLQQTSSQVVNLPY